MYSFRCWCSFLTGMGFSGPKLELSAKGHHVYALRFPLQNLISAMCAILTGRSLRMTRSVRNKRWTRDHNQANLAFLDKSDLRITQQLEPADPKVGFYVLAI